MIKRYISQKEELTYFFANRLVTDWSKYYVLIARAFC